MVLQMTVKGIILAGGSGTRLSPLTKAINKQALPVYNKPMIYYPLSTLIDAGITDILIISTKEGVDVISRMLGDGGDYALKLRYKVQNKPNGIAEAFIIGEEHIGGDDVALILGDNIFYGSNMPRVLRSAITKMQKLGACIFAYPMRDPRRYGVVELKDGIAVSIEEKPAHPKSKIVIPGLYFYNNRVVEIAKTLKPSSRGELEITDVSLAYMYDNELAAIQLDTGYMWLDMGTFESLLDAGNFVKAVEERHGIDIADIARLKY